MTNYFNTSPATDLRRIAAVRNQTGLSAATIYRRVQAGTFPSPLKIGARASAWVGAEIDQWIADRIAARDIC
jgi:prophage regulatory protein